jgi:hypothetical protein
MPRGRDGRVPDARCECTLRYTCGFCMQVCADRNAADRNAAPLPPGGLSYPAIRVAPNGKEYDASHIVRQKYEEGHYECDRCLVYPGSPEALKKCPGYTARSYE